MICPRCKAEIRVFSPEWQSQKGSSERSCPSCSGKVELVLSAKRYSMCFFGLAVVVACLLVLAGLAWPFALFMSAMVSAPIAVLPSFQLSAPMAERKGFRGALYRPLPRPSFVGEGFAGRAGELGRGAVLVVLIAGMAISYLSAPWNGVLLLVLGLVGLWRPELGAARPWALGKSARVVAALLATAGLLLLAHRII